MQSLLDMRLFDPLDVLLLSVYFRPWTNKPLYYLLSRDRIISGAGFFMDIHKLAASNPVDIFIDD
jgi:hypothetical protein